jgi:hypothetical protein
VIAAPTAAPAAPATNTPAIAPQTGTQGAAQASIPASIPGFFTTRAALVTGTVPTASTSAAPNQPGQTGNSVLFSFTTTNSVLPSGLPSPGAATGFTGRIVFANTGTPQRGAYGAGDFSPASGVVPTGLYLNSGGGENAPAPPPVKPAPLPPPVPLPGTFLPGPAGVDDVSDQAAADEALSTFLETL